MTIAFYLMINLVLAARLLFQFKDQPISKKGTLQKSILELAGLLFLEFKVELGVAALGIVLVNVAGYFAEKDSPRLNLRRLLILLVYLVFFSTLFSPVFNFSINKGLFSAIQRLSPYQFGLYYFTRVNWEATLIILFGILLNFNEVNIFIRFLFEQLDLVPLKRQRSTLIIDFKEYNRGRIIGFLERLLIFFFVFYSAFSAVGFILTAKGVTRFKELENRAFAEYFLIGTLMSSVLAGAIALLTKWLVAV